ncbi:MAG: hypothetical protein OXB89_03630, partial [Anaerolineaceae bacterium]|nr:hypothetical protein [Anaerolineaceae bacterium]
TSVLFVIFMAIARAFTLVTMFSILAVYGYWRVALRDRPVNRPDQAILLAGTVGLLYTHYYGALLVPVLGIFHLFLNRRGRRRLSTLAIFLLAGLLSLPQAPTLFQGLDFVRDMGWWSEFALGPHEVVALVLEVYSNGLLGLLPKVAGALFGLALVLFLYSAWRRRLVRQQPEAVWLLVSVVLLLMAFFLAANEIAEVFLPRRTRYALGLWPLFSILVGWWVCRNIQLQRRWLSTPTILLALLLVTGLVGNIRSSLRVRFVYHYPTPPMHLAARDVNDRMQETDKLLVDHEFHATPLPAIVYLERFRDKLVEIPSGEPGNCDSDCLTAFVQNLPPQANLWLMFANPAGDLQNRLQEALLNAGYDHCRSTEYVSFRSLSLIHLVSNAPACA